MMPQHSPGKRELTSALRLRRPHAEDQQDVRSQRELQKQLQGDIDPTEQSFHDDEDDVDSPEIQNQHLQSIEKDSLEDEPAENEAAKSNYEQPESATEAVQSSPGADGLRC